MKTMSDTQFASWGEIRRRGRRKFILQRGVLQLGLPAGLAFGIVFRLSAPAADLPVHIIAISIHTAIFALFGGPLWGWITWRSMEERFLFTQNAREEENALGQSTEIPNKRIEGTAV